MPGFKVLLYHSVGDIDPRDSLGIRVGRENFRRQMEALKEERFDVRLLGELVEAAGNKEALPEKALAITFDDGYKDNITEGAPAMEALGLRATFFVTVGLIGKVKTSPKREWQRWGCMDGGDLRGLAERGHEIGSHGRSHLDMATLPKAEKGDELASSKRELCLLLDKEIDLFSYPYGSFDDETVECLKREGYRAAATTAAGTNDPSTDPYRLKRTEVTANDTLDTFMRKIGWQRR